MLMYSIENHRTN